MQGRGLMWRGVGAAVVAAIAVAVLIAVSLHLDEQVDRTKPMYEQTSKMAQLQYDLLKSGKPGVELTVDSDSPPVRIGGSKFRTSAGVQIVVERRDDSMCVKGSNQYGDETTWECVDGTGPPPIKELSP